MTAERETEEAPEGQDPGLPSVVVVVAVTLAPLFGTTEDPAIAAQALAESLPRRVGIGGGVWEVIDSMYLATPPEDTHDADNRPAPDPEGPAGDEPPEHAG